MNRPVSFVFSTPVWGDGHIELFLDVSLPSLFAPGNFPGLQNNARNKYLIYTTSQDEDRLRNAPAVQRLSEIMSVEIRPIRKKIAAPHETMSHCHLDSMQVADKEQAAAVFLAPDFVWSDGSMVRLEGIANSGKSVVHMSGIRLLRDGVVPELAEHYDPDRSVLSIGARELVGIARRHLHPIAITHFWKDYATGLMPANLIWDVPGEGLLLRCYHLHPLMVKSQVLFAKFNGTIDDDLPLQACPDATRDHVVVDSDELLAFEISGLSRVVGTTCPKGSVEGVAEWVEVGTNARHRGLVHHPIRLHSGDMTPVVWEKTEAESAAVIDDIARLNGLSLEELKESHPAIFAARIQAMSSGWSVFGGGSLARLRILTAERGVIRGTAEFAIQLLLRANSAVYRTMFVRQGVPLFTHPFWLIRRAYLSGVSHCILPADRHVVLVGFASDIAASIRLIRPHVTVETVEAVALDAICGATAMKEADKPQIDRLIVCDADPTFESLALGAAGQQAVLLRIAGDTRPIAGQYKDVRYITSAGARLCWSLWKQASGLRSFLKPKSRAIIFPFLLVSIVVAPLLIFMPLIYGVIALAGVALNLVGLLLDRAAGGRSETNWRSGTTVP